jgi:hypothetical protein
MATKGKTKKPTARREAADETTLSERLAALARLKQFGGFALSNPLILLNRIRKVGTTSRRLGQSVYGLAVVILGGGCGGSFSFRRCSRSC